MPPPVPPEIVKLVSLAFAPGSMLNTGRNIWLLSMKPSLTRVARNQAGDREVFFDRDAIAFEERSSPDGDGVARIGDRDRMADALAGRGGGAARRVVAGRLDVKGLAGSGAGREEEQHQQRDVERDKRET